MTIITLTTVINNSLKKLNNSGQLKNVDTQTAINLVQTDVFNKLDVILERDKYIDNYINEYTNKIVSMVI